MILLYLKLDKIYKSYNREIIKGISLELEDIKSVGIIGKSGCGKSTLLRLLSGIEEFDLGRININNLDLIKENKKKYQKKISMVFQQHNLFPHISILENISLILEKIRGYKKDKAKNISLSLLEQFKLENEILKYPNELSGGQAQRASIARALATNPDLIFMDEPTASLDPILTKEVLDFVKGLKKIGKEFIFVTHEISFVKDFADYIVFMDEGEIIEHGAISILQDPKTKKLRDFLICK